MKGSRRVLVKVVLFQLRGRGHPQDDATPNFFADSFEVYNSFLPQLALKLRAVESGSLEKVPEL